MQAGGSGKDLQPITRSGSFAPTSLRRSRRRGRRAVEGHSVTGVLRFSPPFKNEAARETIAQFQHVTDVAAGDIDSIQAFCQLPREPYSHVVYGADRCARRAFPSDVPRK